MALRIWYIDKPASYYYSNMTRIFISTVETVPLKDGDNILFGLDSVATVKVHEAYYCQMLIFRILSCIRILDS